MSRPRALVVVTGLLAGALVGCAGLPGASPVQHGLEIDQPVMPPLRVRFEPPRAGATPVEIVRGFLAAGVALEDDAAAPRAFLAGTALTQWNPRAGVVIYGSTAPTMTVVNPRTVRLEAEVSALIDEHGRYVEQPAGSRRVALIGLAALPDGEWRIEALPDDFGLWLSASYAEQTFAPFRLHYLSASSRTLVPDVRWLPLVGAGVATTLARAQLEDVPAYLVGAVGTGFPRQSGLAVDSVAIESGEAVVDLTPRLLDAGSQEQRGAWAQLLATLDQAPGVNRVAVLVDGKPLELADTRSPVQSIADLGYAGPGAPRGQRLVTRAGNKLAVTDRGALRGFSEPAPAKQPGSTVVLPLIPAAWTHLAAPPGLTEIAGIDATRSVVRRWSIAAPAASSSASPGTPAERGPHAAAVFDREGRDFAPPAYDRFGVLWLAGTDTAGLPAVWVAGVGSTSLTRVALPGLNGSAVAALRVSGDGQRVALILRARSGRTRLALAGVTRDARGMPTRVGVPLPVGGALVDVRDVTWMDDITVAVLGRRSVDPAVRALVVPLARPTWAMAAVSNPTRIVSTGEGVRGLLVITQSGAVLAPSGGRWQEVGRLTGVVVPGS
ncbi:MAG: GerMN domain-containing protein [Austwickia sp.]|nr:GerMN domain-containing protein [Austwickia sp.]MBK9101580.1 GerMN domain-containing protein [Austwickia sp.]